MEGALDIGLAQLQAINPSWTLNSTTAATCLTATNSYLTFCNIHQLSIEPTVDTLNYYITYQSHFISLASVDSYLSGIINQLEPHYPDI